MNNVFKGRTGLDRVVRATGHSLDGLRAAYEGESAFRQECWLAAALLPAAFWLGRDWVQVALLAGTVLLVLVVELLNSAVEATVDRVSLEDHQLAKRAKDIGSAAVMMSLVTVGVVWLLVLLPRL
jgi:diacylglycerol kinase (ATP)